MLAALFQFEVYDKVDRLLTGLITQQSGKPARWYTNKTPLFSIFLNQNNLLGTRIPAPV